MGISAKVICDSVNESGDRLTTIEATYPRIILAEVNTHRALSRNTASSRAIPVKKMIERVMNDPFMPVYWGKNQAGMQAAEELVGEELELAKAKWLSARDNAVATAQSLVDVGLHKQIANRLLEPFQYITSIFSATDWNNLFFQRCHKDAQPEFQVLAKAMKEAYDASTPRYLVMGRWHMPYMRPEDMDDVRELLPAAEQAGAMSKISAARCARVSYLNHDGVRSIHDDLALFDKLAGPDAVAGRIPGHWSPLEHVAVSMCNASYMGNFKGWKQLRKFYGAENVQSLP